VVYVCIMLMETVTVGEILFLFVEEGDTVFVDVFVCVVEDDTLFV
jgi:biotin carboxyl carrier protein